MEPGTDTQAELDLQVRIRNRAARHHQKVGTAESRRYLGQCTLAVIEARANHYKTR